MRWTGIAFGFADLQGLGSSNGTKPLARVTTQSGAIPSLTFCKS
jgi:hypothetical protein